MPSPAEVDPEELFAAWVEAHEDGKDADFAALLEHHPEHAGPLRRMHSDWAHFAPILERVVPGSISDVEDAAGVPRSSLDDESRQPPDEDLIRRLGIQLPEAGRYRFRAVIGQGGGGVVLRVWDAKLRRPLAMKVVLGRGETRPTGDTPPVDAAVLTRFVDEARIASQLDHPGIVPVHELGTDASGRAFFTMRLVRGEDLGKVFERARRGEPEWTRERLLGVLVRVCEAVGYAHGKGVLHRDLKPANVMLGRHGEVHVMDWGLARTASVPATHFSGVQTVRAEERETRPDSPFLTTFGAAVGTPAYMAPEQARGELERVDARSDVYAIGAMLYELLAGDAPFVPRGAALHPGLVLMRVVEGPPAPLAQTAPDAPEELVAITERAMAREPETRYPDVRSLEADLRAYLEGRVVAAYESGTWAETRKWMRRNRTLAAALGSVIFLLAAGLAATRHLQKKAEATKVELEESEVEARRILYRASIAAAEGARMQHDFRTMRHFLGVAPEAARNVEWQLLDALSDSALAVFDSRDGHLGTARFSPDGASVVTVAEDGLARIWETSTERCSQVLGDNSEHIVGAAFAPDGRSVATITYDGALRLWNLGTGTSTALVRETCGTTGNHDLTFVQGSCALLVESAAGIEVWDVQNRTLMREFAATWRSEFENGIRVSPDGHWIARVDEAGAVSVFDSLSGVVLRQWHTGLRVSMSLEFSTDGTTLAASDGGDEGRTLVMDLGSGMVWGPFAGQKAERGLSDDGAFLLVRPRSGLEVVRVATGELAWNVPGEDYFIGSQWLMPDASAVVASVRLGRKTEVHGRQSGRPLSGHDGFIDELTEGPDGAQILTTSVDGSVRLWDLDGAASYMSLRALAGMSREVLKDSCFAAAGGTAAPRVVGIADGGRMRIWDAWTLDELGGADLPLSGAIGRRSAGTYCPEIESIALASAGRLYVVDPVLARLVTDVPIPLAEPTQVRYLAESRIIEVVDRDGAVAHVMLSQDGAAVSVPAEVARAPGGIVSPRGSFVAVARNRAMESATTIVLHDSSGQPLRELRGHIMHVSGLHFTGDEKRLVSTGDDGTVRIWDTASGELLLRITLGEFEAFDYYAFEHPGYVAEGTLLLPRNPCLSAGCLSLVKERERHRWRQAEAAVRPLAEEWVQVVLNEERDWNGVVARARVAPELEGTLRRAVLNEITRQACGEPKPQGSESEGR